MKNSIISILALAASISANAEISIPQIFGDNMMLQQKADAHIWGWATPGSEISIVPGWDDSIHNTRTDKSGRWDFYIPTPEASYSPYSITVKGDGSDIVLKNVLVGEVWFCSGQSNMEMPLKGFWCQPVENAGRAIAYSGNTRGHCGPLRQLRAAKRRGMHMAGKQTGKRRRLFGCGLFFCTRSHRHP